MELFSIGETSLEGVTELRIEFTEVSGANEATIEFNVFGCIEGISIYLRRKNVLFAPKVRI